METARRFFFCVLMTAAAVIFADVARAEKIKGPPTAEKKELTRIARLGETLRLTCPLEAFPEPMVSWTKDDEAINNYSWERLKTARKYLKIFAVSPEDTGVYVCKGTNGFGSEEIRINLIVIDPAEFPHLSAGELPDVAPPVFTEQTLALRSIAVRKSGENLRLVCEALGKPEPVVVWRRAGGDPAAPALAEGAGRATLIIRNLIESDSGALSCSASNLVGSTTKNFTLRVEDSSAHPALPAGPDNTTVAAGGVASLECTVKSETRPNVKWLKRLEEGDEEALKATSSDIFDMGQDKFLIMAGVDESVRTGTDEYLNRLVISDASEADAGMYYCFVTNTIGYKYKNAYLTVLPRKTASSNSNFSEDPVLILVLCLAVVVFLLLSTIIVCLVVRRQRNKRPTAETPDVQEGLMRQHHLHHSHQQQQQGVKQPSGLGPPLPPPPQQQPQHPHQHHYQQQQYQAASLNNNRNKVLHSSNSDVPPPPPPPPSLHNEGGSGSQQWASGASSVYPSVEKVGSVYGGQNQYEVPHVHTSRVYSSSLYGQQQPIYPYMGQKQHQAASHYGY